MYNVFFPSHATDVIIFHDLSTSLFASVLHLRHHTHNVGLARLACDAAAAAALSLCGETERKREQAHTMLASFRLEIKLPLGRFCICVGLCARCERASIRPSLGFLFLDAVAVKNKKRRIKAAKEIWARVSFVRRRVVAHYNNRDWTSSQIVSDCAQISVSIRFDADTMATAVLLCTCVAMHVQQRAMVRWIPCTLAPWISQCCWANLQMLLEKTLRNRLLTTSDGRHLRCRHSCIFFVRSGTEWSQRDIFLRMNPSPNRYFSADFFHQTLKLIARVWDIEASLRTFKFFGRHTQTARIDKTRSINHCSNAPENNLSAPTIEIGSRQPVDVRKWYFFLYPLL